MFQSLSEKLDQAFKKFRNKGTLTEADVKAGMREIKLALLEADVNFKVVKDFIKIVSERAVGTEVMESLLPGQQIVKIVDEELTRLMGGSQAKLEISSKPPTVIMMVGLQGAGKTTHAGKLAGMYKKQGKRPLQLERIFSKAATLGFPAAVHCEDGSVISENTRRIKEEAGEDPDVKYHPLIRSAEACYRSTESAVELARRFGTRLHIMHISTARELELFGKEDRNITAEATPAHLTFCDKDYARLGTKIKCNPAIKSADDRNALRTAVADGRIDLIGTDHAPHHPDDKVGGALKAASGMPSIQFSLLAMLELVDKGVFTIETLVERMCHAPARIFDIDRRGYIEKGYHADFVLLAPGKPHTIKKEDIISKCGWSPFEGDTFNWNIEQTWVNGECAYSNGVINEEVHGKALRFNR